jgi:hypothetical protein
MTGYKIFVFLFGGAAEPEKIFECAEIETLWIECGKIMQRENVQEVSAFDLPMKNLLFTQFKSKKIRYGQIDE